MNKKKHFAQYYTPKTISNILAKRAMMFLSSPPKNVLELAAGDGQLLVSILELEPKCKVVAVDIDLENIERLRNKYPKFRAIHADAISHNEHLNFTKFDIGVANPPFLSRVEVDHYKKELIKDCLDLELPLGKIIRSEIIFICSYIKHLKRNKILSVILPSSFISGSRSSIFRKAIANKYQILEVFQITDCNFSDTEAETFILTLKKSKPTVHGTYLRNINLKGETVSERFVGNTLLEKRMDPNYYLQESKNGENLLGDVASITRGNLTHKDLKKHMMNYVHTTNFEDNQINQIPKTTLKAHTIKNGDVIMCRVGKRIVGKTREYKGSEVIFSDCIYRLRFKKAYDRERFLTFANSSIGKNEFTRISKGVCSKYITVGDLKQLYF